MNETNKIILKNTQIESRFANMKSIKELRKKNFKENGHKKRILIWISKKYSDRIEFVSNSLKKLEREYESDIDTFEVLSKDKEAEETIMSFFKGDLIAFDYLYENKNASIYKAAEAVIKVYPQIESKNLYHRVVMRNLNESKRIN